MTACAPVIASAQPASTVVSAPIVAQAAASAGLRPLRALVDDLNSPDFGVRAAAGSELAGRQDATLAALEELLRIDALGIEQRAMLAMLARDRFAKEPRAALGVRYANAWNAGRRGTPAVIEDTLEGFDSRRVLKPGDVLVSFDGSPVSDRTDMRAHIISYSPGETARIEVERNDAIIELEVRMGDQGQLQDPPGQNNLAPPFQMPQRAGNFSITSSEFDTAWTIRARRLGLKVGEELGVIDARITEARWRETWLSPDGSTDPRASSQRASVGPAGPRGAGPAAMREFVDGQTIQGGRWGRGRDLSLDERQLAQLQDEADDLRIRIEDLRGRLIEAGQNAGALKEQDRVQFQIDSQRLREFEAQHQSRLRLIEAFRGRINQPRR